MRTPILFVAVMMLTAVGAAFAIKSLTRDTLTAASARSVTISIDGLHHQVDTRSLPELEVKDPF
jgi:hypothetical protein